MEFHLGTEVYRGILDTAKCAELERQGWKLARVAKNPEFGNWVFFYELKG